MPPRRNAKKTKQPSHAFDHVRIEDHGVVLLQFADRGMINVQDVVFNAFAEHSETRQGGAEWMAFHGVDMPHHARKSTWIGISTSVPPKTIVFIEAVLQAAGMDVTREMGRALHLKLNPLARLSDDGLEILVPAALVGDPTKRRVIDRGGAKPIARGYTLEPSKSAALNALFFGG